MYSVVLPAEVLIVGGGWTVYPPTERLKDNTVEAHCKNHVNSCGNCDHASQLVVQTLCMCQG